MRVRQVANIATALLLAPFYRRLKRSRIVLVGGHEGELVADNSKAMYSFLTSQQNTYDAFWVLNRSSAHWASISDPVARGSMRNYLYFMVADGAFFSHTASDIAPILHNFWQGRIVTVFIEHGIVGLKKAKLAVDSRSPHLGPAADLFVCSSEFEKAIKVNEWGLPPDRVRITGLARYDKLIPQDAYRREILFMPTWREWLADDGVDDFVTSDCYRSLLDLVTSPSLVALLEANNYRLKIYLHFYFHKFIGLFEIPHTEFVEFLPVDADVQDYIINSAVMITDYSSVAWDFFYLDKPVLFFQPDLDSYLRMRGSYLDMSTELFGPQSLTTDELVDQLARAIDHPADLVERHRADKERYFAFNDTRNCIRTFDEFSQFRLSHGQ